MHFLTRKAYHVVNASAFDAKVVYLLLRNNLERARVVLLYLDG